MNVHQPQGSIRREGVSVNQRDTGALPLFGREESLTVSGNQVYREADTRGQACVSCGRVMVERGDFYAVCVVCGFAICSEQRCRVSCAEETCQRAVCARDRGKIGENENGQPQYLCLPHFEKWERERLVIGVVVILGVAILASVLFFWMR